MPKDAEEQLEKIVGDVIAALRNPAVLRRVFRRALVGPDERLLAQAIREAVGGLETNLPALAAAYLELYPTVEHFYRREGRRLVPINEKVSIAQ